MAPKKGSKINYAELPRTPKGTICQCGCELEVPFNRYKEVLYLVGHNRSGKSAPGRSLADLHPELATEVYEADPQKIWGGSGKRILWQAECGHVWDETPAHRVWVLSVGKFLGCPFCSGARVLEGFNDLLTTHPEVAAEAYGWNPVTVSKGVVKKMQWKCKDHGHIWQQNPNARTSKGLGCPYCSGKHVWPGFNDLATTHPEIAREAHNFDPTTISRGSTKKVQWRCITCEHIWTTNPNGRTSGASRGGCPQCNGQGFDSSKPGYLYMMCQPDWGLTQIGITNHKNNRTKQHGHSGWSLLNIVGPLPGYEILATESSLKRWLRSEKIPKGRKPDGSKFDGYTESWPEEELLVSSIHELRQLAEV